MRFSCARRCVTSRSGAAEAEHVAVCIETQRGGALQPARGAVLVAPARGDAGDRRAVGTRHERRIARIQQLAEAPADELLWLVAEDRCSGAVGERDGVVGIALPDPVLRALHDVAEALLAGAQRFFGGEACLLALAFGECAAHGGLETAEVALENVVGGAAFQRLDGAILAESAGDEHERQLRAHAAHHVERTHAVESGQREIAEHDVWCERVELIAQTLLGFDAAREDVETPTHQGARDEFGVGLDVLDQQHLDGIRHDDVGD